MSKIVGIDLTGSEKKASGVAFLFESNRVYTTRLKTDAEIIERVKAERPDLVSIDSPLSLPEDPEKIYRDCELTLKLAAMFREAGLDVIESYPGAAQDILGIPRKQKGIQLLADALVEYGITGDLNVSHDELDAITAAIVGRLYLEDKYEALGCLILPKVK
jgi:predicted nuclease with RNAse H fold